MTARHRWDPICDPPSSLSHPVPVDPSGTRGPTRSQAQRAGRPGSAWRRTGLGLYVPSAVDADLPEQRVVEAAGLLPRGGAATGWASLRLHRATFFDGLAADGVTRQPVPLITPTGRRACAGVRWLQDRLLEHEVVIRHGVRITVPERAAYDAMRLADDVRGAVVALDMAMAAELTSIQRMRVYVDARPRWAGAPLARSALDLADEHSRSPAEAQMRLVWMVDAGLPRPLVNQEVFSSRDGRLLGVADLLDVAAGVIGEYDGADHAGARRRSGDARREDRLRDHGLEVFRVTGFDLRDPAAVVRRMLAARERARWEPPRARAWTITPPAGWEPSWSLDQILDHRDVQRETYEQWANQR